MNEKRTIPERWSLLKYAKLTFFGNTAAVLGIFSGLVWIVQWGIGLSAAQVNQVLQIAYVERVILKQNEIIEKQNSLIGKIDEKVAESHRIINDNRVEYLGLIASIRIENKDRNLYSNEKQEQILNEVRKIRK